MDLASIWVDFVFFISYYVERVVLLSRLSPLKPEKCLILFFYGTTGSIRLRRTNRMLCLA
jgi:hypothetical protein